MASDRAHSDGRATAPHNQVNERGRRSVRRPETTADVNHAGTEHSITLTIADKTDRSLVDHTIPDTFQYDLDRGRANFYYVDTDGFTRSQLTDGAIRLAINGDDVWIPSSLFLFGLDAREGQTVRFVTPLVHLPQWTLGPLSQEETEGTPSQPLPLVAF
jgi:hypothetical protein